MDTHRTAISLIEVVVVIVILAILAALLLPAIQTARNAARHHSPYEFKTAAASDDGQPAIAGEGPAAPNFPPAGAADRKIIYTARIELQVEDFAHTSEKVTELVKKSGGYIADSAVTGTSGEYRTGNWRIRVPVTSFDEFVKTARGLGELITANTGSQDATEEYYDVEARLRNKTKEEERLLKLLEDRPGKLEEVIAAEHELSRVREEIERMQGHMRYLADRSTLTNVELMATEVHSFQPAETPSFATRISRAFGGSLFGLQSVGEWFAVCMVALLPWLVVFGVVFGAGYRLLRPFIPKTAAKSGVDSFA